MNKNNRLETLLGSDLDTPMGAAEYAAIKRLNEMDREGTTEFDDWAKEGFEGFIAIPLKKEKVYDL